jgi:hypothetical protein
MYTHTRTSYTDANGVKRFAGSNALVPDLSPARQEMEQLYKTFGVDSRDRCENDYAERAKKCAEY